MKADAAGSHSLQALASRTRIEPAAVLAPEKMERVE